MSISNSRIEGKVVKRNCEIGRKIHAHLVEYCHTNLVFMLLERNLKLCVIYKMGNFFKNY